MKRDDLTLGLLGVITLLLVVNTYLITQIDGGSEPEMPATKEEAAQPSNTVPTPAMQNTNTSPTPTPTPSPTPAPSPEPTGPTTTMKFANYDVDFGNVKPLSNNAHTFKFTNTGDVPLVIENCRGTCGCTVPECPNEPIMPNQTGEIKVVFTPKETQLGIQEKQVIITANIPTKTMNLKVKANVVE